MLLGAFCWNVILFRDLYQTTPVTFNLATLEDILMRYKTGKQQTYENIALLRIMSSFLNSLSVFLSLLQFLVSSCQVYHHYKRKTLDLELCSINEIQQNVNLVEPVLSVPAAL